MRLQFPLLSVHMNLYIIIFNMNPRFRQYRIIERPERIEILRIDFRCPVAPHQMILKEDADFRNKRLSLFILCDGNLDARHQIFFPVRAKYSDGKLGTGQDNRLVQSFQHKAECGSSISHRIRAVQNDKTLITVIVLVNNGN